MREVSAIDDEAFLDPRSARVELIRTALDEAADEIAREIRSRFRVIGGEGATFGLACASGAVGAVVAGPVGAAAAGGGAWVAAKIVDWLRDRPGEARDRIRRFVAEVFVAS
jgi:Xaa-Pro aminopeptidase